MLLIRPRERAHYIAAIARCGYSSRGGTVPAPSRHRRLRSCRLSDPQEPPQAPQFDPAPLLALRERADLLFRVPQQGSFDLKTAARVLCAFYKALERDDDFWGAVGSIVGDPDVQRILQAPADFEVQEYVLLAQAGVDHVTALGLAADLKSGLDRYQPGSMPGLPDIRDAVRRLGEAVCAAESGLGDDEPPAQRHRKVKLLARALNVAGLIVSIGLNIPLTLVFAVVSVIAGLMSVSGAVADYLADHPNDG